jgi:hypothetical protein
LSKFTSEEHQSFAIEERSNKIVFVEKYFKDFFSAENVEWQGRKTTLHIYVLKFTKRNLYDLNIIGLWRTLIILFVLKVNIE